MSTNPNMEPLAVGAKEAAEILGVSPASFERMKAAGALEHAKFVPPGMSHPRYSVARLRELVNTLCDSN